MRAAGTLVRAGRRVASSSRPLRASPEAATPSRPLPLPRQRLPCTIPLPGPRPPTPPTPSIRSELRQCTKIQKGMCQRLGLPPYPCEAAKETFIILGMMNVPFSVPFVDRLPDRGEPYTPVALLLSHGHGYDRVNYHCKMLGVFPEDKADLELRELFSVCWHPAGVVEGQPAAPDVQSMPNGMYGDIFDVLVDRPNRLKALLDYPVVWAAGDVDLTNPAVEDYVRKGGTLVVNVEAARALPKERLGVRFTGK